MTWTFASGGQRTGQTGSMYHALGEGVDFVEELLLLDAEHVFAAKS